MTMPQQAPLSGDKKPTASSTTTSKLKALIADNFLAYYKAHTFHLNVTGPDFAQYHGLFEEVYDKLWEWHDTLSEQLRQGGDMYPFTLAAVAKMADLKDDAAGVTDCTKMIAATCSDLEELLAEGEGVYATADPALETVIGDYCADVKKLCWKLSATLGKC